MCQSQERLTSGDLISCSPVILRSNYYQPGDYTAAVWQRKDWSLSPSASSTSCGGTPRPLFYPPQKLACREFSRELEDLRCSFACYYPGHPSLSAKLHCCGYAEGCNQSSQPLHRPQFGSYRLWRPLANHGNTWIWTPSPIPF